MARKLGVYFPWEHGIVSSSGKNTCVGTWTQFSQLRDHPFWFRFSFLLSSANQTFVLKMYQELPSSKRTPFVRVSCGEQDVLCTLLGLLSFVFSGDSFLWCHRFEMILINITGSKMSPGLQNLRWAAVFGGRDQFYLVLISCFCTPCGCLCLMQTSHFLSWWTLVPGLYLFALLQMIDIVLIMPGSFDFTRHSFLHAEKISCPHCRLDARPEIKTSRGTNFRFVSWHLFWK